MARMLEEEDYGTSGWKAEVEAALEAKKNGTAKEGILILPLMKVPPWQPLHWARGFMEALAFT